MRPRLLRRVGQPIGVLRRSPRGDRFQTLNRQRGTRPAGRAHRVVSLAAGVLLVAVGLVTYPIPGPPSTLMVIAGLALIAQEWMWVAQGLDASEVRIHAVFRRGITRWRSLGRGIKSALGFVSLVLIAGCAWVIYLVLRPG